MSIAALLKSRHVRCDELFIALEQRCVDQQWTSANPLIDEFGKSLANHLSEEEDIAFPAFEAATGMTQGPTQVMRAEHAQMRALVAQIERAVNGRDADAVGGAAETLLILMQQHNLKEENILYPMFDRVLSADEILAALQHQEASA
jgi:hemerythrin-like domain-containing protein